MNLAPNTLRASQKLTAARALQAMFRRRQLIEHYGASARHAGIRCAATPRTRRTNDETSRFQRLGVAATSETPAFGSFMTRCASATQLSQI
jgi:hypothetical protein